MSIICTVDIVDDAMVGPIIGVDTNKNHMMMLLCRIQGRMVVEWVGHDNRSPRINTV